MAKFNFGKFLGNTASTAGGTAAGAATAGVLAPVIQEEVNRAWAQFPNRPVGAGTLAEGVAQGQVDLDAARAEARLSGYSGSAFATMVDIANVGPPLGQAMEAYRRDLLSDSDFVRALKRAGIEEEWDTALLALRDGRLSAEVIANAIQQGHVPDDGILPPPVTGGTPFSIPLTTIDISAIPEAAAHGVTPDRLKVLANLAGLPPGDQELLHMWNRGIIDEASVDAGIREGHRKTKWIPAVKELRHAVLSATTYAGLRLRGWITPEESFTGVALSGHSQEQMDALFLDRGRPATTHQVWIGLQRGGKYVGESLTERETFDRAIKQSDLRPEWSDLLWAQRYTYPSSFVLRALTADGTFTRAQAEAILKESGWRPDLAEQAARKWAEGTGSAGKDATAANLRAEYEGMFISRAELVAGLVALGYDPHEAELLANLGDAARVKKYRDAVVKAIYEAFLGHSIDAARALDDLAGIGVDAEGAQSLVDVWTQELGVAQKGLTTAQIKRAYAKATLTRADALERLEDKGYSPGDAAVYLDS